MNEPKIRFKGFQGEWETSIIGDIATFSKGRGYSKSDLRSEGNPIVLYGRLYTNYASVIESVDTFASLQNGAVITKGNEVIIPGSGETPEDIAIASAVEQKGVILGGDINVLSFDQDKIVPTFAAMSITNSKTHYELSGYAQGKTVVHLHNSSISKGHISYPYIDEQRAIASYFQHLDALIQSTTKKIESLKQVKAASLQSMFPQEGETTPRVRFKGFEGEWEKVSLGEETYPAGIKNYENLPLDSYSISNEFGFIPQNLQFENGGTMATADKRMYYIVSKNSFGYNPARINVGSLGYYSGNENVIVSSLYEIFKTSDRICDTFLLYWFKTSMFQKLIEQYQEGGVRFYFFYDKLCMCQILVPSYEEQCAIASYFTNLDRQITLHTQRLEKLKQIKAACLDKMFV